MAATYSLAFYILSLLVMGSACEAMDDAAQLDSLQHLQPVPDQLDNNGKRLKARHFDPYSTFVLPFPHQIMPADPVPDWCYVNSQEEYDATPVGMWMIDSHGNGAVKRDSLPAPPGGACPVVVTQEDYDALPVGTTYRCRGTLFLKQAPAPTPVPAVSTPVHVAPTPYLKPVSSRQFPVRGVLTFLIAGLFVFAAWRLFGIKPKAPPPHRKPPPERYGPANGKRQPVNVVSRSQACQILGISVTATLDEAKSAYRALVRRYHPDFADRLGPELKEIAHIKTTEFNAAMAFIAKS
jgi:hypothetical protein